MNFNNPGKYPDLDGGKNDAEALQYLFKNLHFTVLVHPNLIAAHMWDAVEHYSKINHEHKVFVLIILSHGKEGDIVLGTDGGEVKVHELQEHFHTTRCPSLAGVPKVFLIDACRGSNKEKKHMDSSVKGPPNESHSSVIGITDSADFITVYASTRGNVAYMYTNDSGKSGSYFTQTLVQVMTEADKDREFNEIITEVRHRIHEAQTQTVQTNSTLMKLYYIKGFAFNLPTNIEQRVDSMNKM